MFDTESSISEENFSYALNRRLPEDIKIRASKEVAADFHPRHCGSVKTYEYRICNAAFPIPTKRLYAHFTYVPLDVSLMSRAAAYLVGEHDFKSFCSADTQAQTTVRQVDDIRVWAEPLTDVVTAGCILQGPADREKQRVTQTGKEIVIRVTGRGFLYNMVRIMAGGRVGGGRAGSYLYMSLPPRVRPVRFGVAVSGRG